jgi:hypothetical protein
MVSEAKALKIMNPRWTLKLISEEMAHNDEIKQRLGHGDLAPGYIERILKGKGIGSRGRPKETVK